MSTMSTWTPKPPNVAQQLRPRRAVDRGRGDDPVARCGAATRARRGSRPSRRRGRARPRRRPAPRRRRRARSWSGWRSGCRRSPARASAATRPELLGVGRGERGGLVDRHARRRLVERRDARGGADGPRREALAVGGRGRGSVSLTGRCYTGETGRPGCGIGTPVTRSLPARFEAYIAPSALIISSSAVRPSSG